MTTFANSMLLLGLALTLFLAAISIFYFRSSMPDADGPRPMTRFFLVALRLSIGWHFFVEGMDKLSAPSWSSEPYLREASGPLAPYFRDLAGDRLTDKLTVGKDGAFPAELDLEWRTYLDAFNRFYELDPERDKQNLPILFASTIGVTGSSLGPLAAAAALAPERFKKQAMMIVYYQAKANTLAWLTVTPKTVQKPSENPPPLLVAMTVPKRLKEYHALEAKVRDIEDVRLPRYGAEVFAELKTAKAHLNKWRAELKADLAGQTLKFKQALRDQVLVAIAVSALPAEYQAKISSKEPLTSLQSAYHELLLKKPAELSPQAAKIFEYAIDRKKDKQDANELLPRPPGPPANGWHVLDWSDFFVKWGITLTGAFLLLGLLTRTSCVLGACLLFSFFLAMPPLPGWPESPRAEGHYLFINKNIIEMLALLTLATTRSGRWAGLDGLLQFLRPRRWQYVPASSSLDKVVKIGDEPTVAINEPELKP